MCTRVCVCWGGGKGSYVVNPGESNSISQEHQSQHVSQIPDVLDIRQSS